MLVEILKKASPFVQKKLVQLLYLKNGKRLIDFKCLVKDKYYAYQVKDVYVPQDSLAWFVDYDYYYQSAAKICNYQYGPKQGDLVIDIGAGIGEEAIVFSKLVGNSGSVYGIEANPEVFNVLSQIIDLNSLTNVKLFNIAINSENVAVQLSDAGESFLSGSIVNGSDSTRSYTVPGKRFDSFVKENNIGIIDLLKVNIEGAERFVIDSITDPSNIKNFAIACHDFRYCSEHNEFFRTKELVTEYLRDHHFKVSSQQTGIGYIDDWVYGSQKNLN